MDIDLIFIHISSLIVIFYLLLPLRLILPSSQNKHTKNIFHDYLYYYCDIKFWTGGQ